MRRFLKAFYDGTNLPEFLLALVALLAVPVGGIYRIDAGTISDTRAAAVAAHVAHFPGLLGVMKADRDQAYQQSYTHDMPTSLDYQAHFRKQQLDRGEDTIVWSADGRDSYRVTGLFPRLVRKQFLGSVFGDEPNTLAAVGRFKPRQLDFNPRWFFYGGAYQYPVAACIAIGVVTMHGPGALGLDAVLRDPRIARTMYISARLFGVLAATLGALVLGLIVSRLFGPRAACVALILGASSPWLVMFGHLAKPYTTALLWSYICVYWTIRHAESHKLRHFLLSAIFAGLAVGSNYVFIVFSGFMASWKFIEFLGALGNAQGRVAWRAHLDKALLHLVAYAVIVGVVFLLVNPYWLFTLDVVRSELRMADKSTMLNYRSIRPLNAGWPGVLRTLVYAANPPLTLAGIVALTWAGLLALTPGRRALPRAPMLAAIALFLIPFLTFSISYNSFILMQSTHYMAAFVLLLFAVFTGALWPRRFRAVGLVVLALGLAYNLVHTGLYLASLDDLKERNASFGRDLEELIPRGATITTRLAVCDTTDTFEQSMNHPPQVWISALLPDFDFFEREWRFRLHVLPEPSPIDATYVIDTIGDAWELPEPGITRTYDLVAEQRRRHFLPGSRLNAIWPRIIDTYDYKDIQVWRKKPPTS